MCLHKYLHFEPEATVQLFFNPESRVVPCFQKLTMLITPTAVVVLKTNYSDFLMIPELTPYVTQAPSNELLTEGNRRDVCDPCLTYCFLQTKTASDSRVVSK